MSELKSKCCGAEIEHKRCDTIDGVYPHCVKCGNPCKVIEEKPQTAEEFKAGILGEFEDRFFNNEVYWREVVSEIRIGDPDFISLRCKIKESLDRAIEFGRKNNE
jgi:hypothetical protein